MKQFYSKRNNFMVKTQYLFWEFLPCSACGNKTRVHTLIIFQERHMCSPKERSRQGISCSWTKVYLEKWPKYVPHFISTPKTGNTSLKLVFRFYCVQSVDLCKISAEYFLVQESFRTESQAGPKKYRGKVHWMEYVFPRGPRLGMVGMGIILALLLVFTHSPPPAVGNPAPRGEWASGGPWPSGGAERVSTVWNHPSLSTLLPSPMVYGSRPQLPVGTCSDGTKALAGKPLDAIPTVILDAVLYPSHVHDIIRLFVW